MNILALYSYNKHLIYIFNIYFKWHHYAYCADYNSTFSMLDNTNKINPNFKTNPKDYSKVEINTVTEKGKAAAVQRTTDFINEDEQLQSKE